MKKEQLEKYWEQFIDGLHIVGEYTLDFLAWSGKGLEYLNELLSPTKHELTAEFKNSKSLFTKKGDGFALQPHRYLTARKSFEGVYYGGGSGSGKTSFGIISSIINVAGSRIIHDGEKELHEVTSKALHDMNVCVMQLDLEKPYESHGYNPLLRISTIGEIHKLATSLVAFTSANKQDYFENMSVQIITNLIRVVKLLPLSYQNLFQVAKLLELLQSKTGREKLDMLVAYLTEQDEGLLEQYEAIVSNSPNTLSSITSSASTALNIFLNNDHIRKVTSHDTLGDFQQMRDREIALFLHTGNSSNVHYYSVVTNLFLDQFFSFFYKEMSKPHEQSIFFILDELPVLRINGLASIASTIRKRRGALNIVCQDGLRQLSAKYDQEEAQAIMSNMRTKIYYGCSNEEALALSREFGKYEYLDSEKNDARRTRELMTPDEILALEDGRALIVSRGHRPILTRKLTPYYADRKIKKLTDLKPVAGYPIIDYDLEPKVFDIEAYLNEVDKK